MKSEPASLSMVSATMLHEARSYRTRPAPALQSSIGSRFPTSAMRQSAAFASASYPRSNRVDMRIFSFSRNFDRSGQMRRATASASAFMISGGMDGGTKCLCRYAAHSSLPSILFPSSSVVRAPSVGERATCVSGRAAGLPAFPPELAGPLHSGMPGRFFGTQQDIHRDETHER